jgi:hypothetical protein
LDIKKLLEIDGRQGGERGRCLITIDHPMVRRRGRHLCRTEPEEFAMRHSGAMSQSVTQLRGMNEMAEFKYLT